MMRLDDLIRELLDDTDTYTHRQLSEKLCDTEPGAVAEYLHANRVNLVVAVVAAIARSRRSWTAANRARSVFADAVDEGAEAVDEWRRGFGSAAFAVNDENVQKKVSRMTRDECLYVARRYDDRSRENGLMAAVFRAVAERVPAGKEVGEVYTEEELEDLRRRTLGLDD